MKKTIQILTILLLINCGTRKTSTEKIKENVSFSTGQNLSKTEEAETKSETSIDFSKFSENQNIAVIADGNPSQSITKDSFIQELHPWKSPIKKSR